MSDETVMPFGKYKGQLMSRIPARYLVYIYETYKDEWLRGRPREYIERNLDKLRKDAEASRLRKETSTRN